MNTNALRIANTINRSSLPSTTAAAAGLAKRGRSAALPGGGNRLLWDVSQQQQEPVATAAAAPMMAPNATNGDTIAILCFQQEAPAAAAPPVVAAAVATPPRLSLLNTLATVYPFSLLSQLWFHRQDRYRVFAGNAFQTELAIHASQISRHAHWWRSGGLWQTQSCALLEDVGGEWVDRHHMKPMDKIVLKEYTKHGWMDIHGPMRRRGTATVAQCQQIHAMKRIIDKASIEAFEGIVYRGTTVPIHVFDELRPGATYQDEAFLMTTRDPDTALFDDDEAQVGDVWFQIVSKTGKDIQRYSYYPMQQEVLFRPNTLFKIHRVCIGRGGEKYVQMEEVV